MWYIMGEKVIYIISGISRLSIIAVFPILFSKDLFQSKIKFSLYILMLLTGVLYLIISYIYEFKRRK